MLISEGSTVSIDVDKSAAASMLQSILKQCRETPVVACPISETIDFAFSAKNSLTYRYILFTALTAKAVEPNIDILSLQASDESVGAYDARSLCSKTVYPFQKLFLSDMIDGSNSDPLVNKPGRYPRLSPSNAAASGDPRRVLSMLCENLPKVDSAECARLCLSYLITKLLKKEKIKREMDVEFAEAAELVDKKNARRLIDNLIDQGFGGAGITIAASAVLRVMFTKEDNYEVIPHPMNQSGASSRQYSDLDVLRYHKPWLGVELKDKPFTNRDVAHATQTAANAGAKALLFIGGRASMVSEKTNAYFSETRRKWMDSGLYVGVMPIDALIDFAFATHEIDVQRLINDLRVSAERMKAIEPQMWIYEHTSAVKKES